MLTGTKGFVEFGGQLHHPHPAWDVIIGRQEVVLGTGRFLDDNEGVNVRSAFDGVRIGYDKPKGRVDLIAIKPVGINPGVGHVAVASKGCYERPNFAIPVRFGESLEALRRVTKRAPIPLIVGSALPKPKWSHPHV